MENTMKMPEVNLDLIAATSVSMQRNKKFWDEEAEKILLENPLIYRLLNFTDTHSTKSDDYKAGYKKGAALIYSLISRQIEVDNMNKDWGEEE